MFGTGKWGSPRQVGSVIQVLEVIQRLEDRRVRGRCAFSKVLER